MTSGVASAVVALDIGGTKIASAIGDAHGELHRWRTLPTEAERGAERVLESATALANEVLCEERASGGDVRAIGVSPMGLTRADRVDLAPNVPGFEGRHVVSYTIVNAAAIVAIAIPAVLIFLLNRWIVEGIIAGSVK
jgi:glucokinase